MIKSILCQCGCKESVTIYRGKPRRFKQGHALRTPELRKYHSERMSGNTLFAGRCHSNETKKKIAAHQTGNGNSVWNNGRTIANGGYVMLLVRNHPHADVNGRVKEEHLVIEKHIGRYLIPNEVVHHKDENKQNNKIKNLQVMTRKEHSAYHCRKRKLWMFSNNAK